MTWLRRLAALVAVSLLASGLLAGAGHAQSPIQSFPDIGTNGSVYPLPDPAFTTEDLWITQGIGSPQVVTDFKIDPLRLGYIFPGPIPPAVPYLYQLWWDNAQSIPIPILMYWDGSQWRPLFSSTPPITAVIQINAGDGITLTPNPITSVGSVACTQFTTATNGCVSKPSSDSDHHVLQDDNTWVPVVESVSFVGNGVVDSSTPTTPCTGPTCVLTATILTQAAHKALAGPTSGGAATPTFRELACADISDAGPGCDSGTAVTSITATAPVVVTPSPITSTGVISLTVPTADLLGGNGSNFTSVTVGSQLLLATGTLSAPLFTSIANGTVPLSGGGTVNYLRADGTWDAPPGANCGSFSTATGVVFVNGSLTCDEDASYFYRSATSGNGATGGIGVIHIVGQDNGLEPDFLGLTVTGAGTQGHGAFRVYDQSQTGYLAIGKVDGDFSYINLEGSSGNYGNLSFCTQGSCNFGFNIDFPESTGWTYTMKGGVNAGQVAQWLNTGGIPALRLTSVNGGGANSSLTQGCFGAPAPQCNIGWQLNANNTINSYIASTMSFGTDINPSSSQVYVDGNIDTNGTFLVNGSQISCSDLSGGCAAGAVSSVGLAAPSGGVFGVTGSPVTTTGTLTLTATGTQGGIPYFSTSSAIGSTAALTQHAVIVGGGTGTPTALAALTDGQLYIGSTGADPVPANITSTGATITITNTAGGINLESVGGSAITALTGDGTATGPGSVALTIRSIPHEWTALQKYDAADFGLVDTSAAHQVLWTATSSPALTADRTFTLDMVNGSRTIALGADMTIASDPGVVSGALRSNGSGTFAHAACADLSNGATGCSTATGTSGATIPVLNASNTWTSSTTQTFGAVLGIGRTVSGTTDTLAATDCGTVIEYTSGSAVTTTTLTAIASGSTVCSIGLYQHGAGQVTISDGSSATHVSLNSCTKTSGQYALMSLAVYAGVNGSEYNVSGQCS